MKLIFFSRIMLFGRLFLQLDDCCTQLLDGEFSDEAFGVTVVIHDGEHPTDIYTDATLKGGVKFEVARHGFPVAIERETDETTLAIEHTRTRIASRDIVSGKEAERKLTCAWVDVLLRELAALHPFIDLRNQFEVEVVGVLFMLVEE